MALSVKVSTTFVSLQRPFLRLAALRAPPISRPICTSANLLNKNEDMDDLKKNPYFEKYAGKIARMQQTSPEEFLQRLAVVEDANRTPDDSGLGGSKVPEARDLSLPTRRKSSGHPSMLSEKSLNSVMKMDLLKDKSVEEISEIWKAHYSGKDSVCAVIPADVWTRMQQRMREHKTFLFPLPRKQGYEFVVVQFTEKEAHFTTLINYQAFQENAPECLVLVHYTDLLADKGIVLMVGEFDTNHMTRDESAVLVIQLLQFYGLDSFPKKSALLERFTYETDEFDPFDLIAESSQEAQCLANQVELYYSNPSEVKKHLMDVFTNRPAEFKHTDLIAQMENISLLTSSGAVEELIGNKTQL